MSNKAEPNEQETENTAAHLDVVVHGEIAHGLGVRVADPGVLLEGLLPVRGQGEALHDLVQDEHVLHAL